MKEESTLKLYLNWIILIVLAALSATILIPLGIATLIAMSVGRGYHQRVALRHILLELREIPAGKNISRKVKV